MKMFAKTRLMSVLVFSTSVPPSSSRDHGNIKQNEPNEPSKPASGPPGYSHSSKTVTALPLEPLAHGTRLSPTLWRRARPSLAGAWEGPLTPRSLRTVQSITTIGRSKQLRKAGSRSIFGTVAGCSLGRVGRLSGQDAVLRTLLRQLVSFGNCNRNAGT